VKQELGLLSLPRRYTPLAERTNLPPFFARSPFFFRLHPFFCFCVFTKAKIDGREVALQQPSPFARLELRRRCHLPSAREKWKSMLASGIEVSSSWISNPSSCCTYYRSSMRGNCACLSLARSITWRRILYCGNNTACIDFLQVIILPCIFRALLCQRCVAAILSSAIAKCFTMQSIRNWKAYCKEINREEWKSEGCGSHIIVSAGGLEASNTIKSSPGNPSLAFRSIMLRRSMLGVGRHQYTFRLDTKGGEYSLCYYEWVLILCSR